MEIVEKKIEKLNQALQTLTSAIELHEKYMQLAFSEQQLELALLALATRDSMIQRFEYCTDMLWKLIKVYLEKVQNITLTMNSPKGIIREAVLSRFLSEDEGEECMDMIKKRNETSHIYLEEVAEDIAKVIPKFYQLMHIIVTRITSQNK